MTIAKLKEHAEAQLKRGFGVEEHKLIVELIEQKEKYKKMWDKLYNLARNGIILTCDRMQEIEKEIDK